MPYKRRGWCPEKQVVPFLVDVSDVVKADETTSIHYQLLIRVRTMDLFRRARTAFLVTSRGETLRFPGKSSGLRLSSKR